MILCLAGSLILAYRMIAGVMKLNPDIKGYFGINWINDPQIERISPRLSYIRYMNIACGCSHFYLGANDESIKKRHHEIRHQK